MIEEIDWTLRIFTTGVSWGAIPIILMGQKTRKKVALACLAFVSPLVLFAFSRQADELAIQNDTANLAAYIIYTAHPIFVMWAMLELLDPYFKPRPVHAIFVASTLAAFIVSYFQIIRGFPTIIVLFTYSFLIHRAFILNKIDQDHSRRRFRLVFLSVLGCLFILQTTIRLAYYGTPENPDIFYLTQGPMILSLTVALLYWTLRPRSEVLEHPKVDSTRLPKMSPGTDRFGMEKVHNAMEEGVWRTEGLTIGKMSKLLNLPEYRIRKTINRDLGFRNFSHFLNDYRVREAARILGDAQSAGLPILTIAHNVGYSSIGPFNRAFKDIVGMSPSAYRQEKLPEFREHAGSVIANQQLEHASKEKSVEASLPHVDRIS